MVHRDRSHVWLAAGVGSAAVLSYLALKLGDGTPIFGLGKPVGIFLICAGAALVGIGVVSGPDWKWSNILGGASLASFGISSLIGYSLPLLIVAGALFIGSAVADLKAPRTEGRLGQKR